MNKREVIENLKTMKKFSDAKANGFAKTHKVFEDESEALVVAIECVEESQVKDKMVEWFEKEIEIARSVGPMGAATMLTLNNGLKILKGEE